MKYKNLFTIAFLPLCHLLFAQGEIGGRQIVNDGFVLTTPSNLNNKVNGSPYIQENFVPGKISLYDNKIFAIKYDALLDEILVQNNDNNSEVFAFKSNGKKNIVITIISNNKSYQIFDYINGSGEKKSSFFVLLANSNKTVQLLKKERIKFYEEKVATSGYDQSRPAEYRRLDDSYYLVINNQPAIEISSNKKDVARLFPNHEKKIIDFIKSDKIQLKDEEDLQRLVLYLQGL